jgi:hypothetical protein
MTTKQKIKGRWKQNYRDNCPECKRYSLYVCDKKGTNSHVRRYKYKMTTKQKIKRLLIELGLIKPYDIRTNKKGVVFIR